MFAEEFRVFDRISLYLTGYSTRDGSVTFGRMIFCTFMYFKEAGCLSEFPFSDPFALNPLSQPYLEKDGHHIIDLSFYSEITIIEEPPRLCLHDITQELGVSLNFESKDAFQDMFEYLKKIMTIVSPGLPGFFEIERFRPCEAYHEGLDEKMKAWVNAPSKGEDVLEAHSVKINEMMTTIVSWLGSPSEGEAPTATIEQVDAALTSVVEMKKLVKRFSVPVERKADVWAFLVGLYSPDLELKPSLREQFLTIKKQWKTVTQSQYSRGEVLRKRFAECTDFVTKNKQTLFTVVVVDPFILTLAFDVLMSVTQVYMFMENHLGSLKDLFRVFLWMFVKNLEKRNDQPVFIGHNNKEMDVDTLEALIFWSILFMMEMGEIRRMLKSPDSTSNELMKQISDVIFLLHPLMYRHLHSRGLTNFKDLAPMITTHLSTLPLCDCADIWISALASDNFADLTHFMVIACLFFSLPETISREQPLTTIVEQTFQCLGHRYLITAAFVINERFREIVAEKPEASDQ